MTAWFVFYQPQVMGLRVTCPFTQEDMLQDYYKSEWEHCMRHCLTLHLWGQNFLVLALSPLLQGQSVKCSQWRGKVNHLCVNSMRAEASLFSTGHLSQHSLIPLSAEQNALNWYIVKALVFFYLNTHWTWGLDCLHLKGSSHNGWQMWRSSSRSLSLVGS